MTRTRFLDLAGKNGLDFACLVAQAMGISVTQIELWRVTATGKPSVPA